MTDLHSLKARIDEANGPDRELDAAICIAFQYVGPFAPGATNVKLDEDDAGWLLYDHQGIECTDYIPSLTSSIDAALALVERMLPEPRYVEMKTSTQYPPFVHIIGGGANIRSAEGRGKTIPLALLSALLLTQDNPQTPPQSKGEGV